MKALLLVALAAAPVTSTSDFIAGDALAEYVKANCSAGCVVFSPDDYEKLRDGINAIIQRNAQKAFEAGKRSSDITCGKMT